MGLTDYSRMDKEFFESGVRAEQERIIKLLEDDFWHNLVPTQQIVLASGTYVSGRYHHAKNCHGCRFIALIKGETE